MKKRKRPINWIAVIYVVLLAFCVWYCVVYIHDVMSSDLPLFVKLRLLK